MSQAIPVDGLRFPGMIPRAATLSAMPNPPQAMLRIAASQMPKSDIVAAGRHPLADP